MKEKGTNCKRDGLTTDKQRMNERRTNNGRTADKRRTNNGQMADEQHANDGRTADEQWANNGWTMDKRWTNDEQTNNYRMTNEERMNEQRTKDERTRMKDKRINDIQNEQGTNAQNYMLNRPCLFIMTLATYLNSLEGINKRHHKTQNTYKLSDPIFCKMLWRFAFRKM
jgi:hypothetical protein